MANPSPILIIGAGASGLMAAIAASRMRPHSVLLLEKEARVGRKLLATGNGRCNLMNLQPERRRLHGSGAHVAVSLLSQTPPRALRELFAGLGLLCREEAEGRVYPFSGQASAVLDVLRQAAARQGVKTVTDCRAMAIRQVDDGFAVDTTQGGMAACRVIIAAGGMATPSLGSTGDAYTLLAQLGHTIAAPQPAIVPLRLPADRVRGLKGVRAQVALALYDGKKAVQRESGEALFTDYGISGVAAMQLARRVNTAGRPLTLGIALMPRELAETEMTRRAQALEGQPLETLFTGLLHKQLGLCLLREAGLSPQAQTTVQAAARLAPLLHDWRIPVEDTQPFAQAQVTAGGAILHEFDEETLQSLLAPGLYACGEALDVDGDCGGYNLMWAWLSGLAAGEAAARSLEG